MNLKQELLKDHSKKQASRIQQYIGNNPVLFDELVNVFLEGPYRVTQRAAWPLSLCVEKHPELAKPHLKALIKNLARANQHDAVKRNTFRLLQYVDIPKKIHGITVDACVGVLQNRKEPIAVRVFAMTTLTNIAMKYPEMIDEVKLIVEDQMAVGSAGIISRGKKMLKQLNALA